jgi:hypothetical protein
VLVILAQGLRRQSVTSRLIFAIEGVIEHELISASTRTVMTSWRRSQRKGAVEQAKGPGRGTRCCPLARPEQRAAPKIPQIHIVASVAPTMVP